MLFVSCMVSFLVVCVLVLTLLVLKMFVLSEIKIFSIFNFCVFCYIWLQICHDLFCRFGSIYQPISLEQFYWTSFYVRTVIFTGIYNVYSYFWLCWDWKELEIHPWRLTCCNVILNSLITHFKLCARIFGLINPIFGLMYPKNHRCQRQWQEAHPGTHPAWDLLTVCGWHLTDFLF